MFKEIQDEAIKELNEDKKKLSDRLQELEEWKVQRSPLEMRMHKRRSPVSETTTPPRLGDRRLTRLNSSRGR